MKKDVYQDPEVKAFLNQFAKNGLPQIMNSGVFLALASDDPDPKMCIEIGAAVLLDKPIIVCLPEGRKVSAHLRTIAQKIVTVGPDGQLNAQAKAELEDAIYMATRSQDQDRRATS